MLLRDQPAGRGDLKREKWSPVPGKEVVQPTSGQKKIQDRQKREDGDMLTLKFEKRQLSFKKCSVQAPYSHAIKEEERVSLWSSHR